MAADNLDQFGGAATSGARGTSGDISGGAEPPASRPYPVTLNELEGCFDNLEGAAVTGKDTLDELVKSNMTLSKAIADLTETNSRLAKKFEHQAAEFKKRGGGRVEEPGGIET